MSSDRDTTRIVRSWLEDGVTRLPDNVLDAVLDKLPATHQRRATWWPAWRLFQMNKALVFGAAAAGVAIVALIGFSIVSNQAIGGPDLGVPSPSPTATPAAVELPRTGGELDPGTYFVDDPALTPARFTFEVPAGWETIAGGHVGKIRDRSFYVLFSPWVVDQAYSDPCQWVGAELVPELGPTVDDLAAALANQVGRDASTPSDVMLGGYPAKKVELSVPEDFDKDSCDAGEFRTWRGLGSSGGFNFGPGQRDTVYITDVDGERLVIQTMYLPTASGDDVAELRAIVDSIRIEP